MTKLELAKFLKELFENCPLSIYQDDDLSGLYTCYSLDQEELLSRLDKIIKEE